MWNVMKKEYIGKIGLLFVALIWGTGYVASAIALDYFTPLQVLACRFFISGCLMSLIFIKQLKKLTLSEVKHGAVLGLCLYLAFLFQTVGLNYTSVSNNAFLTSVNVVLVPLISYILYKTPIRRNVMVGAVLSLIGIGFLSLGNVVGINIGDGLTLVCAFFFACQIMLTSRFVENDNAVSLSIIQMITAGIIALLVAFSVNGGYEINLSKYGWISILYLGAISTMLAFLIQTISQKYTTGSETAVILSTESLFGALASIIILGETPTYRMVLGGILIFIGVLITEGKEKEAK